MCTTMALGVVMAIMVVVVVLLLVLAVFRLLRGRHRSRHIRTMLLKQLETALLALITIKCL